MKHTIKALLCAVILLMAVAATPVWAGERSALLSANVPLDSPVYSYLGKFEGLGYLHGVSTGTKPYSRLQVAEWVMEVKECLGADATAPAFTQKLLKGLEEEFRAELAVLRGEEEPENSIVLREINWTNTYYHGEALPQHRTLSTYQPLNINNNGYKLADGLNTALTATIETGVGDYFVVSTTPHVNWNEHEDPDLSLEAGYCKTRLGNLEILAGKDAMWWGQGERGSRVLTNNSTPQTAVKLGNITPIRLGGIMKSLRQMNASFFYAELEGDRSDVRDPSFVGLRMDFSPTANFTFAGSLNAIVGGEGHALHGSDYWGFIIGENATTAGEDKWNTIAGLDLRWRIPRCNGLQIYAELYGEDQAGSFPPLPYKNSWLAGFYLPRLTPDGAWELTIEAAETTKVWYTHSLYRNGYTYRGDLLGDAMGNDAERIYAKLAYFMPAGSSWSFHAEYLKMGKDTTVYPQEVVSCWITYRAEIYQAFSLSATAGIAGVDNVGFQAGGSDKHYILSIELIKAL